MQKVIEKIPNTAGKASFEINPEVDKIIHDSKVLDSFTSASISARLFKESYIILNLDDGVLSTAPVDFSTAGLIDFYPVEVGQLIFETDNFGNRTMYYLQTENNTKVSIHPDRVLLFYGRWYPTKVRVALKGYHGSVIGAVLPSYGVISHALNISLSLLARVVTFVFKMAGLQDLVKADNEEMITRRLQIHKKGIGSTGGLVIDAESEDVAWLNLNLSGIPEVMRIQRESFTAETELTHDILWNEGSHTTSSDLELHNWQNQINEFIMRHWQENFNKIVQVVCNSVGTPYKESPLTYIDPVLKEMQDRQDQQLQAQLAAKTGQSSDETSDKKSESKKDSQANQSNA